MENNNNEQPVAPPDEAVPQPDAPAASEPAAEIEPTVIEPQAQADAPAQPEPAAGDETVAETASAPSAEPHEAVAEPAPQAEVQQPPATVTDSGEVVQEVAPPEGESSSEPAAAPSRPLSGGEGSAVGSARAESEQVAADEPQLTMSTEGQSQAELPATSEGDSHIVITIPADSAATELTEGTTMMSKEALPPPPPSAAPTNRGFDNWVQEIPTSDRGSAHGTSEAMAAAMPKAITPRQSPKTQSESGVGVQGPSRASASGKQQKQAQSTGAGTERSGGGALQTTYGRRKLPDSHEEEQSVVSALNPVWAFGFNARVPVVNLSTSKRRLILYASSHVGVLYDFEHNSQRLLQGHSNNLSCLCSSADKRWIATGDRGLGSVVIVWDSNTATPVRTIFEPHKYGVVAIALSPDAKFLATLSAPNPAASTPQPQTFAIWDWTTGSEEPLCSAVLPPEYGLQNYIHFNPESVSEVVTNSENQVIFYSWREENLMYYAHPLSDRDFNKAIGQYCATVFVKGTTRALSATSLGNIVIWDSDSPGGSSRHARLRTSGGFGGALAPELNANKKPLKILKVQEKAITVFTRVDDYIVTGDVLGRVRFFDLNVKLLYWMQELELGPINALSFTYYAEGERSAPERALFPTDSTIPASAFEFKNLVIGTSNSKCAHLVAATRTLELVLDEHDSAVHAIAAHPHESKLVICSTNGLLKLWNYATKITLATRHFEKGGGVTTCAFDPRGEYLVVGFHNGTVRVLDTLTLRDEVDPPFTLTRAAITHIAFDADSTYMATTDADFSLTLFMRTPRPERQNPYAAAAAGVIPAPGASSSDSGASGASQASAELQPWTYLARYRSHYRPIRALLFGMHIDTRKPRLMTLGEDRMMNEYDLGACGKDKIVIQSQNRFEQSAVPLCMMWYPPIYKEQFLCTANDSYKFKLYNAATKMCRKTVLGPVFGSPPQRMALLNLEQKTGQAHEAAALEVEGGKEPVFYMAYVSADKVGLQQLPFDGNPNRSMALICHPRGVSNLATSFDGRYVFTAGGDDWNVHLWKVHTELLERQIATGGDGLVPFYALLDGGRTGQFFADLEDYFYYAQLKSQGINSMDTRKVSVTIPLAEIPYVMRAIGYYPTELEIEDMLNEVKFSRFVETGQTHDEIDLGEFIKLYINHRPVFGLSFDKLRWAFEKLGVINSDDGSLSIEHDVLLDLLQTKGEHMSEEELAECLVTLLGFLPEGGRGERDPTPPAGIAGELASSAHSAGAADVTTLLDRHLPYQVTLEHFASSLLGLRLPEHLRAAADASAAGGQDTKRSKKNAAGGGSERRSSRTSSAAASKSAENASNPKANNNGRPRTSSVAVST